MASGASVVFLDAVLTPTAGAGRLTPEFAALERKGGVLAKRVFMPGQTIPWPVPVHVAGDWTLTFADRPAIALLHSLGLSGNDGQLTIVSNNILLERLDDGQIDYANDDRRVTYTGSTTPDAAPNVWRVRPALTTDKATRGAGFDKLLFDIGGPLNGFTRSGDQIRRPDYRLGIPYRLNWYSGHVAGTALVDPVHQLCVSEKPIDRHHLELVRGEVALYRRATVGASPIVMVSQSRQLRDASDSFEANYDERSSIALINSHYLTAAEPGLTVVVDQLLGAAIFASAAASPIPKLTNLARAVETELDQAKSSPESLRPFAFPGDAAGADAGGIFAVGLDTMRRRPAEFEQALAGLSPTGQAAARRLKNAVIGLVRAGLELNGHEELLGRFAAEPIQRL